jgi:DNA-binding response OmpR family regulator
LIVMDIQMPYISGLELIEQLKADAELKRVPIMAVTAYAATGDEERIRDAGAEGYVSKPISLMKFIGSVRELLEAAAAREAEEEAAAPVEEQPAEVPEPAEQPEELPEPEAFDESPQPNVDQAENPAGDPRLPDEAHGGEEPPRLT